MIEPGKKAPAFGLQDRHGATHKLSQHAGRPVILYFYPKDGTPGCTTESCDFQARLPAKCLQALSEGMASPRQP